MSRIAKRFAELKKANRAAFVPFITAGDPDSETTCALLEKLPGAGAAGEFVSAGATFLRSGACPTLGARGGGGAKRCPR